jgi:uncharacterized protein YkwD
MIFVPSLLLLASLAGGGVCGAGGAAAVLAELNAARGEAGRPAVAPHPALCEAARWRASEVARSGAIDNDVAVLRETARRIRSAGYSAHRWTESTLIGVGDDGLLGQFRQVNPRWVEQAVGGEFEHVGIGLARYRGRPVCTLLLGFTVRTAEWRQAAPLADLGEVRRLALAAVNGARREAGRRPLEADPALDAAAQAHAEDMLRRAYYSHRSPEGQGTTGRLRAAGHSPRGPVAENIAKGLFTPGEVVERWLASPGHRRNILLRQARRVGIGVAFGDNDNGFEVLWVQVFSG